MSGELTPPPKKAASGLPLLGSRTDAAVAPWSPDSGSTPTVDNLPDEVLLPIFSYLSTGEIVNVVQEVCTRWKLLSQHSWKLKEYVIRDETSIQEAIKMLRAMPLLRTLKLEDRVSCEVLKVVSENCHNLTTLDTGTRMAIKYPVAKKLFKKCNKIRTLKTSGDALAGGNRFVRALAQLPHLQALHLCRGLEWSGDVPLRSIANNCPRLCELDLGSCDYQIEDAEYFINSKKDVLKHLVIHWRSKEWRFVVPLLTVCADNLEFLGLISYRILANDHDPAETFAPLWKLSRLHTLFLSGFSSVPPSEFYLLFRNGGMAGLKDLRLHDVQLLQEDFLLTISEGCPELQSLTLEELSKRTVAFFEPLCTLKKLETLKLAHICINVGGGDLLEQVGRVSTLQRLELSVMSAFSARDAEHLLKLSELQYLSINRIWCSGVPFDRFPGRLVNLRKLVLVRCTGEQSKIDGMLALMPYLVVEGELKGWDTQSGYVVTHYPGQRSSVYRRPHNVSHSFDVDF